MKKTLIDVINDYKEFGIINKDLSTEEVLEKVYRPRQVK